MSTTEMKQKGGEQQQEPETKPEVFGPSESEGRKFGGTEAQGEKAGPPHKGKKGKVDTAAVEAGMTVQAGGKVDIEASEAGMVVENRELVQQYRDDLLQWIHNSEEEMHCGLEDALTGEIKKQLGEADERMRRCRRRSSNWSATT
jgi:hypothetical protein